MKLIVISFCFTSLYMIIIRILLLLSGLLFVSCGGLTNKTFVLPNGDSVHKYDGIKKYISRYQLKLSPYEGWVGFFPDSIFNKISFTTSDSSAYSINDYVSDQTKLESQENGLVIRVTLTCTKPYDSDKILTKIIKTYPGIIIHKSKYGLCIYDKKGEIFGKLWLNEQTISSLNFY